MNHAIIFILAGLTILVPSAPGVSADVTGRPTVAQQTQPDPGLPLLEGDPAPRMRGEFVMRTYSLDFYRLPGAVDAETIRSMAMLVETSLISDTTAMGSGLHGRVSIRFEPEQRGVCAIRGLTMSAERTIRLFYAPEANQSRMVAILAHELAHQLQHDYYGTAIHRKSDIILLEGMAVWLSRAYFSDASGQPYYQRQVAQALVEDALLPLTTSLEADCRTTTRNYIYDEWASFVEYLVERYGREHLDAVYRTGHGRAAGTADYEAVYGLSFARLEADWRHWLKQQTPEPPQYSFGYTARNYLDACPLSEKSRRT